MTRDRRLEPTHPITLVPLDATNDVPVTAAAYAELAQDHSAAGADVVFEMLARNPFLVGEGNYFWDSPAATQLITPALATFEDATLRVDGSGADSGRLVRDRRARPSGTRCGQTPPPSSASSSPGCGAGSRETNRSSCPRR